VRLRHGKARWLHRASARLREKSARSTRDPPTHRQMQNFSDILLARAEETHGTEQSSADIASGPIARGKIQSRAKDSAMLPAALLPSPPRRASATAQEAPRGGSLDRCRSRDSRRSAPGRPRPVDFRVPAREAIRATASRVGPANKTLLRE